MTIISIELIGIITSVVLNSEYFNIPIIKFENSDIRKNKLSSNQHLTFFDKIKIFHSKTNKKFFLGKLYCF